MRNTITPEMCSPPQLARLWGVSSEKIIHLINSGELSATNLATSQIGRPRYRISKDAREQFLRSRQVVPSGGPSTTKRLRRKAAAGVTEFF